MEATGKKASDHARATQASATGPAAKRIAAKPKAASVRTMASAANPVAIPRGGPPQVKRKRATTPTEIKTSTLHLRLKRGLKEEAALILADAGMSVPEAVRVFLGRVVSDGRLPFELEIPNAATRRAMDEADRMTAVRFRTAGEFFDDLEKNRRR